MKLLLAVLLVTLLVGCGNVVPPGTTVIILGTDGETTIKTSGLYRATGRDRAYFVDTRLKSFTEKLNVLCADDVNMSVSIKWIGSFEATKDKIKVIKDKVPSEKVSEGDIDGYRLSLKKFYDTTMSDIIVGRAKSVISQYNTDNIRPNRAKIEATIKKSVLAKLEVLNYPVATSDLILSNLDYDPVITQQRQAIKKARLDDQLKAAEAKARVAQAKRDDDIAREEGKAVLTRARTEARANNIKSSSITPAILALRQWEVLEKMALGPNNELIVLPYEAVNTKTLNQAINRRSIRAKQ